MERGNKEYRGCLQIAPPPGRTEGEEMVPSGELQRKQVAILLPYQRRWVEDRSPLKIWLASRQVGKSFALAMEAVREALTRRCNNLILSSSERQSQEVMRKVYMHLRYFDVRSAGVLGAERETREEVELPNGSRILSLPSNPDTVRGFSGNVFLDEFAFHTDSDGIWRAMYPTVTRGYGIRVSSTPNGRQNMFHRLWSRDARFSRHRTDIHDAREEGLRVDVEALRGGIADPEAWAQEFECAFLDEATAYLTYGMISACEDEGAKMEFDISDFKSQTGSLYLGVDVGRKHDLTVLWLLERVGDVFWTRMVREMRGERFSLQRDNLYSLLDGSFLQGACGTKSPLSRCCIDSSGLGAQLAEEASERFGPRVEGVSFTSQVKEDLAVTAKRAFEDRRLRIPADRRLREDLHSLKRSVTRAGNVRYAAERGGESHADRFWALALALHAGSLPARETRYERVGARERGLGDRGCW
jgi:phage FluMu gp28-like protein